MVQLFTTETILRFSVFVGVLAAMLIWERLAPRRPTEGPPGQRWVSNFGLAVLNRVILHAVALVSVAALAESQGWGLFNMAQLPQWSVILASIVLLDGVVYFQHRLLHAVPVLWRMHRVHHSDIEFDTTTGLRFHPFEAILSFAIKAAAVVIFGAPVVAVVAFEVLLNATSLFNHGNVNLPAALDRILRKVVVTPDMHRVHHSTQPDEHNRNFGFSLSWWDYLFGTYRDQPAESHTGMVIGLDGFRSMNNLNLGKLLTQPFRF